MKIKEEFCDWRRELDNLYYAGRYDDISKRNQKFIENMKFKVRKTGYVLTERQAKRIKKIHDSYLSD